MTPAAPSRTTLAGLLLAGAWLGSAGVAAAQEDGGSGSTTTTVPPTTSTTVPPTTTTTTPLQAMASGRHPAQVAYDNYTARRAAEAEAGESGDAAGPTGAGGAAPTSEPALVGDPAPGDPAGVSVAEPALAGLLGHEVGAPTATIGATVVAAPVALDALPLAVPLGGGTTTGTGVRTDDAGLPSPISGLAAAAAAMVPASAPHGSGDPAPAPTLLSTTPAPAPLDGTAALQASEPGGTDQTGQAENPERGPPTTIATGDATATGNQADTTIEQTNIIIVTERGPLQISTSYNPDAGTGWVNGTLPGGDAFGAGVPAEVAAMRVRSGASSSSGTGAARIDTGDATATGNDSTTTINQTNLVVVTADGTDLDVGQSSGVSNVGVASATTGGNTAQGGGSGDGSAAIDTGDANAVGNRSSTVINQTNYVVVTGDNSSVNVEQTADVDNIGVASASTGDNTALGGGTGGSGTANVTTGDASAVGNSSTTTITQTNVAIVTGDRSTVTAAQQADVTNDGTADASTGGNTAIGGTGDGDGSAIVDTGDATATGNSSTTTVEQEGFAVVTGRDSGADLSQTSNVNNVGVATADSGNNTAKAA